MKNFNANFKDKPTLFLILGIFVLLVGIPFGIYALTFSGGASLGGLIVLLAVFAFVPFLVIDRILVNTINTIRLSVYELIFSVIILLFYLW
ncbi:hypothetical protein [uncultured Winogradskyella sp.]|uniref:hypothetical protein n=1 Tax=uncultured Winogradskyella sp. TaxID=395353 RepID=UPI0030D9062F|tara:strand:- start:168573 stop:168845 length:273 start_codon:yes stop_codon:yes gene_type:complete